MLQQVISFVSVILIAIVTKRTQIKWRMVFMLSFLHFLLVYIFLDLSYIQDSCYFMTLAMMMESRAFSRRFMSCI